MTTPNETTHRHHAYCTVIEPPHPLRLIRFTELFAYRDLFVFFIWREIKVRYAQSALGISWAIIQPLISAIIMMVVFAYFADLGTEGAPKLLFYFCPLVPWICFANALTDGTISLINNAPMLSKVYFPRLILPLAIICARLLDFAIAFLLLCVLVFLWGPGLSFKVLVVPLLVVMMILASAGLGLWFTALAVQYRDVKYATPFIVQLLMYCSPVIYSTRGIPDAVPFLGLSINVRWLYGVNPMAGVVEGFRAAFLANIPMPWDMIVVGSFSAIGLAVSGVIYFRKRERIFADVA